MSFRQLFAACLVASSCCVAVARAADIVSEDAMIPSGDPGISLFVRNKHPADLTTFRPERTLLYVHGTSQASEATFDLALDGQSWMDVIAARGFDVYLVDVRGFGRSTRPPAMNAPADANPPVTPTDVAIRDVGAAVDYVLKRRGLQKLDLLGWSWGTVTTGAYTAVHGDKVNRLVLYAPVWVTTPPVAADATPLPAYATWTPEAARANLQQGAPPGMADVLMPASAVAAWSAAELATDPEGARRTPPVVRSPNGPPSDSQHYWRAGKPFYDPAQITVPTLVIHGEWDGIIPSTRARAFFDHLTSAPERRFIDVGEATHFMMLERNRAQLYREVQLFLEE